jgi:vancomycin resistance protein VanW
VARVVLDESPMTLADETRVGRWTRRFKVAALSAQRLVDWAARPEEYGAVVHASGRFPHLLYGARIPLERHDAHPVFEQGKRHNVRLAAPAFDGLEISPARPFSFWRVLGRVTEERGFRYGMELQGGCIVPAIGGGLCLLSRALFQLAVHAGFDVLERHGHSLIAVEPPPGALWGLDATVLWPYVDLRFAPRRGRVALKVQVTDGALHVSARSNLPPEGQVELSAIDEREHDGVRSNRIVRRVGGVFRDVVAVNRSRVLAAAEQQRSCLTCSETGCHSRVVPELAQRGKPSAQDSGARDETGDLERTEAA